MSRERSEMRAWFAGHALGAIIEADGAQFFSKADDHARFAVEHADALIAALAKADTTAEGE